MKRIKIIAVGKSAFNDRLNNIMKDVDMKKNEDKQERNIDLGNTGFILLPKAILESFGIDPERINPRVSEQANVSKEPLEFEVEEITPAEIKKSLGEAYEKVNAFLSSATPMEIIGALGEAIGMGVGESEDSVEEETSKGMEREFESAVEVDKFNDVNENLDINNALNIPNPKTGLDLIGITSRGVILQRLKRDVNKALDELIELEKQYEPRRF